MEESLFNEPIKESVNSDLEIAMEKTIEKLKQNTLEKNYIGGLDLDSTKQGKFFPTDIAENNIEKKLQKKIKEVIKKGYVSEPFDNSYAHDYGNFRITSLREETLEKPRKNQLTIGKGGDSFVIKITDNMGSETLRFDINGDIFVKGNLAEIDSQVVDAFRVFLKSGKFHP